MITKDECGDYKCTLVDMEVELKRFSTRYGELNEDQKKVVIDAMGHPHTRDKTEIDEFKELIDRAKEKGAWETMKESVVNSYEKLRAVFDSKVEDAKVKE